MTENQKYAIISSNELTSLFTSSCVSRQNNDTQHNMYFGKCNLIRSRHIGTGRDRMLIVKHKSVGCKHRKESSELAPKVITPITQLTEQAKSSLQSEGSEIIEKNINIATVTSDEGVQHTLQHNIKSTPVSKTEKRKRTPVQKIGGKRFKTSVRKRIKDLLT